MEGSESRRAPSPTATEGKRRGDVGDVLSEATAAFTLAALALLPRRRPPTAKFIEGKKANLWRQRRRDNGAHSFLPPSLPPPLSLNTHSLVVDGSERKNGRTNEDWKREKEGRKGRLRRLPANGFNVGGE